MNLGLLLLIVFLVLLIGSAPVYPYSRSWGYAPMGGLGTLLVIILILILLGIIPFGGPVAPTPVTVP
ncbi:MAG: DUF3309 family protein [Aureliella sp.]